MSTTQCHAPNLSSSSSRLCRLEQLRSGKRLQNARSDYISARVSIGHQEQREEKTHETKDSTEVLDPSGLSRRRRVGRFSTAKRTARPVARVRAAFTSTGIGTEHTARSPARQRAAFEPCRRRVDHSVRVILVLAPSAVACWQVRWRAGLGRVGRGGVDVFFRFGAFGRGAGVSVQRRQSQAGGQRGF